MDDYQTSTAADMSTGTHEYESDPGHWLVMLTLLYFIPSIIAFSRHHHNRTAIRRLNAVLGWSVLGWIAAFVWALVSFRRGRATRAPAAPESLGRVPECAAARLLTDRVHPDLTI
ncbi:superinfection immunity protein [Paraburkholderia silviterrae]|nr:superinfection immunity protein [Paraburkholderia silviterrae]